MEYSKKIQEEMDILDLSVEKVEIIDYGISNPFYVSTEGSEFKYAKIKNLLDDYKNIYILCLENNINMTPDNKNKIKLFYQKDTDISELKAQSNLVSLVKGPFALIHHQTIRSGLVAVDKDLLEYFNHDFNELNDKELIYMMLETKESNVKSWLNLYENNNLDNFIEKKIFSSYYGLDDIKMEDHLLSLIDTIDDFKYWQNNRNCKLSINNAFNDRKFNLSYISKWNLQFNEIEKELQKILQNFSENKTNITKSSCYPGQDKEPFIREETKNPLEIKLYVDGSKVDNKNYYYLDKPEELTISKEMIEELLLNHSLNEKEKYRLICNLLLSKKYCHYVLNNNNILTTNKDLFDKYSPIIRYVMGYSWISMYMEESIRKTKTKESDRFVFDIETASKLPVFPFSDVLPQLNPYFSCMVSDIFLDLNKNIGGVKQSIEYQNGIVNLAEFRRRLNIFISGNANTDILNGANWSNMAITGGCMAGIIPSTNPLMALFRKNTDPKVPIQDTELERFFQEYYSNSDIDIACNHNNILDFIEHVKHLQTVICTNLGEKINKYEVKTIPHKSLAIYINDKILKEKCENGEIPYDYDYILENKNNRAVKFYFYELYIEQKKISNIKNKNILGDKVNEDEYFRIINYCDFEQTVITINNYSFEKDDYCSTESNSGIATAYYINNYNSKMINEQNGNNTHEDKNPNFFIKFNETLKFKIESKHLKHTFEIFRIVDKEFFSCISKFHLPCVRSYYNGTNCYLLPSAITAYQTLTNIDFKYFVGSKDPISIIDKYRKRGYATVLNKFEVKQYLSYVMAVDNCKKAYGINETKDVEKIIGSLDVNHVFFKPRKYLPENFAVDPNIVLDYSTVKMDYADSINSILNYYKKKYNSYSSELTMKRTIQRSGEIDAVRHWMIDASYDMLN